MLMELTNAMGDKTTNEQQRQKTMETGQCLPGAPAVTP